jgi:hypothetical protein
MKASFSDYLCSSAFHSSGASFPPEMYKRLVAANIKSETALLRWARERYPTEYKRYHFLSSGTGRELMLRLWAKFLEWAEQ